MKNKTNETLQELKLEVIAFAVNKLLKENIKHFVRNDIVFYTKEENNYQLDVAPLILENLGTSSINEILQDVDMLIDLGWFGKPSLDRITPYLVTKEEYETQYASIPVCRDLNNGTVVMYYDNMIGPNGTFLNELGTYDLEELNEVAVKNICSFYNDISFEFKEFSVAGLFKFESIIHTDDARALLHVEKIGLAIKELVGKNYYFVFSNNGSLFVANIDSNIKALMAEHIKCNANMAEYSYQILKNIDDEISSVQVKQIT